MVIRRALCGLAWLVLACGSNDTERELAGLGGGGQGSGGQGGTSGHAGSGARSGMGGSSGQGTGGNGGNITCSEQNAQAEFLGAPHPTGAAAEGEVRINESALLQPMDGVGAAMYAFPFANDLNWRWEKVRFVFDELKLRYIRIAPWFNYWEPINDNQDSSQIKWEGFARQSGVNGSHDVPPRHDLPLTEWLFNRKLEVMTGIWSVGDWLSSGSPRRIPKSGYSELGESIAAYHLQLKARGALPPVAEVQNEPDIEAGIQYERPEDLRDAALALLDQFDRNGLANLKLHGPNTSSPEKAASWAAVWLGNDRLAARTQAVSFHTWWRTQRSEYEAIRMVAEKHQKPVWATEVGLCPLAPPDNPQGCFGGKSFLLPETWATAWETAESYYRAIAWSQASRVYHWTLLGHDALLTREGQRTPTFYVFKQFANFIDAGSYQIESASGDNSLRSLAFYHPACRRRSLVLINGASGAKSISVTSVTGMVFRAKNAVSSSEGSYEQAVSVSGPNAKGQISLTLPGLSVTSLYLD